MVGNDIHEINVRAATGLYVFKQVTFITCDSNPSIRLWCTYSQSNRLASFLGPAQLSVACSSRAGRAWKRGYESPGCESRASLVPRFPGTRNVQAFCARWYLFSRDHDILKNRKGTFFSCALFNQLCVQLSVCMIFAPR